MSLSWSLTEREKPFFNERDNEIVARIYRVARLYILNQWWGLFCVENDHLWRRNDQRLFNKIINKISFLIQRFGFLVQFRSLVSARRRNSQHIHLSYNLSKTYLPACNLEQFECYLILDMEMHVTDVRTFQRECVISALRRKKICCETFNVVRMVAFRHEVLDNMHKCWICPIR